MFTCRNNLSTNLYARLSFLFVHRFLKVKFHGHEYDISLDRVGHCWELHVLSFFYLSLCLWVMTPNLRDMLVQFPTKIYSFEILTWAHYKLNKTFVIHFSGVWCWRGQNLAFEQSEDLQIDYSSYKWTKLDSKSEDCKKKVEDYFRQQGSDSTGREFCDGKIFK